MLGSITLPMNRTRRRSMERRMRSATLPERGRAAMVERAEGEGIMTTPMIDELQRRAQALTIAPSSLWIATVNSDRSDIIPSIASSANHADTLLSR
jgi:hypothetical protein